MLSDKEVTQKNTNRDSRRKSMWQLNDIITNSMAALVALATVIFFTSEPIGLVLGCSAMSVLFGYHIKKLVQLYRPMLTSLVLAGWAVAVVLTMWRVG